MLYQAILQTVLPHKFAYDNNIELILKSEHQCDQSIAVIVDCNADINIYKFRTIAITYIYNMLINNNYTNMTLDDIEQNENFNELLSTITKRIIILYPSNTQELLSCIQHIEDMCHRYNDSSSVKKDDNFSNNITLKLVAIDNISFSYYMERNDGKIIDKNDYHYYVCYIDRVV